VGYFKKVSNVGIARTPELIAVALGSDVVGTAYEPGIIGGTVAAQFFEEFFQAGVNLALGAIAVEIQRQIGRRRHALVYDGQGPRIKRGARGLDKA
jgi:hypothetical protein